MVDMTFKAVNMTVNDDHMMAKTVHKTINDGEDDGPNDSDS